MAGRAEDAQRSKIRLEKKNDGTVMFRIDSFLRFPHPRAADPSFGVISLTETNSCYFAL